MNLALERPYVGEKWVEETEPGEENALQVLLKSPRVKTPGWLEIEDRTLTSDLGGAVAVLGTALPFTSYYLSSSRG